MIGSVVTPKSFRFTILGILTLGVLLFALVPLSDHRPMFDPPSQMTIRTPDRGVKSNKVYSWTFLPEKDLFCVRTEKETICAKKITIFYAGRALVDFYPNPETSRP